VTELKEEEFNATDPAASATPDMPDISLAPITPIKEWLFDSDLELLIPDSYVSNITERLSLYKELNSLDTDEELSNFRTEIEDRFGTVPRATEDLLKTITLRRLSKKIGWEKITLKGGTMTAIFGYTSDANYYQSEIFTKVLDYISKHSKTSALKEKGEKLTIVIKDIETVEDAVAVVYEIAGY
ncbi:MAG: transcription-repair coupling factor, partial [Bacteroidales bacterium]|nr:transcription-repair coupling factor [Bacteroidales bacterium]